MSLPDRAWSDGLLALRLLAVDPGLGGVVVRARAGPVRDTFLKAATAMIGPLRRITPMISDQALFGGLDLSATLATGRLVQEQGLLAAPQPLLLTSAERATPRLAAHLSEALDRMEGHRLIALDEGTEDEAAPAGLSERLAFHVDLTEVTLADAVFDEVAKTAPFAATALDETLQQIARIAARFGIDSPRAGLFALRAAKTHAALMGGSSVATEDIEVACTLTLAHRATQFPTSEPKEPEAPPPEAEKEQESITLPDELLLEAVRAMLPDDLLDRIAARKARQGKGSGSGAALKGNRRGRPLPSRTGRLSDGARIDLFGTLRAAAPWQTIRRAATGRDGLQIRQADIQVKRYEEKTDRLLIFLVDASGSAALARLAEAKGAVELLLVQAYARRDHVSLIAFRGTGAELLLPPTRSLVQTKRRLAGLPGGGGTPLAAGLKEALSQALLAKRRGLTPTVVVLTDGRANIALDGTANRQQAGKDAGLIARQLQVKGVDSIVIDTGNRPEKTLKALSLTLNATYLPLPRADARRLSTAVSQALGD